MTDIPRTPLDDNDLIITALRLACDAHARQRDKAGAPYILHPLHVGLAGVTTDEIVAGLLHDVVEDGHATLDDLRREGIPERVLEVIDSLTVRPGESYDGYIDRVLLNTVAARIKLRDLEHNMDLRRMETVAEADAKRLARYLNAWRKIRARLSAGIVPGSDREG